jgi:hypothetical protein
MGVRIALNVAGKAAGFAQRLLLCEGDANPFLPSPDNVAVLTNIARCEVDGNFVGNGCEAWYVKRSAGRGHISDSALDVLAVELNRSGLEYSLANCCASVGHNPLIKL